MSYPAFPQSEAGAIWLLILPSPMMNGMGEIGVCLHSGDITRFSTILQTAFNILKGYLYYI